ncbi:MAG: glycoside hydrolase family 2 TIM barrel-domain containing protein [Paludibacter sp.]|nr:glycoside hydrolase family 2 TIM barrel-domain containing protein [Paludibacter sp.]
MFALKNKLTTLLCAISLLTFQQLSAQNSRTIINFDTDWKFLQTDIKGAETVSFDDSKWSKLDVPHDWSIEGAYDQNNPTSRGGGYLPSGIGWYRKSFTVNLTDAKKKFFIEFDGVMANSDVWINGFHLGKRPYGYSSFSYDLTGHLKFGKNDKNVLVVKADNLGQPASRYYTGAGIYRHVRLLKTSPVHVAQWGVYITTPEVSDKKALVKIQTEVINESTSASSIVLSTSIVDPSGNTVKSTETKQTIAVGKTVKIDQSVELSNPMLWNLEAPNLYKAITKITNGKDNVDNESTPFGVRSSKFEAATGYWLNGKNIKIKGVCLHHDAGALGAAVPVSAWERRFNLLKETGVNAIRTAHNPVAPEFLDLCDKMGFLVMDETFDTWTAAKPGSEYGYNLFFNDWWKEDTRSMVQRDRNHPSIIIYSVGNEIRDNLNDPDGIKRYKDQQDFVHQIDSSRPVTMALFRPAISRVYVNGLADMMDIVGQNYREKELVAAHLEKPERIVIGTENAHDLNQWLALRDNQFMSGQFIWAGYDYLGEARWPSISFDQGLFDRTGGWKPLGLQRQSWWLDKPVVHIVRKDDNGGVGNWVANWTPIDMGTYDDASVDVYSNCDEVELFLNNQSLGTLEKPKDDAPRHWDVTFEKGTLKAVGKNKGQIVATEEYKTAGKPDALILSVDKNQISKNFDDVAYVTVKVVDENGILCPNADKLIKFSITDAGQVVAVDNGNTMSHESYRGMERRAFEGKCIAIVRAKTASGKITITANSPELKSGEVTIEIK